MSTGTGSAKSQGGEDLCPAATMCWKTKSVQYMCPQIEPNRTELQALELLPLSKSKA